ncbi:hypothetical protein QE152_g29990 [Popillia japonica]|uniref:Uncharacterized protein n=1 Tax=Popillia japonica TaxID=7064 RepID=A0AAW1JFW8_POPJA
MSSEDNSDEIKEKKRRATQEQEIEGAYGRSKRTVKVPNNEPKMEAGKFRSKNVMISGHAFNDKGPEELKVVTNNFLKVNLDLDINVKKVTKLAEKVYRIELDNEEDKEKVMRKSRKSISHRTG